MAVANDMEEMQVLQNSMLRAVTKTDSEPASGWNVPAVNWSPHWQGSFSSLSLTIAS